MTAQFPLSSDDIRKRIDDMRTRLRAMEARLQMAQADRERFANHAVEVQKYAVSLMQMLQDLGHDVPDSSHLEKEWIYT